MCELKNRAARGSLVRRARAAVHNVSDTGRASVAEAQCSSRGAWEGCMIMWYTRAVQESSPKRAKYGFTPPRFFIFFSNFFFSGSGQSRVDRMAIGNYRNAFRNKTPYLRKFL